MRTSTAYFAGAGTVIVAIVSGIGGGLLIANMVNPQTAKQGTEMSLMERRKTPEPVPVKVGPSEPAQYMAAPSLPAPAAAAPVAEQPAPPTEAINSAPSAAPPATVTAAAPTAQPAVPPAEPATPAAQEKRRGSSQDAFSKAQEADIKRDADAKRLADKRKAERERRQHWAGKRRHQQWQEQELREVEDRVREETEPRRGSAIEPARIEMPQIRLFGEE
jgi:hypothetical protein